MLHHRVSAKSSDRVLLSRVLRHHTHVTLEVRIHPIASQGAQAALVAASLRVHGDGADDFRDHYRQSLVFLITNEKSNGYFSI